ncbi:hypothetical protein [Scytonema sp. NUACC26]
MEPSKISILWCGEQRRAGVPPVEATAGRPRPPLANDEFTTLEDV